MEPPENDVDYNAKIVWDYLKLNQPVKRCDAIFVLCSLDIRVAERAAELFLDGFGKYVIFSGKYGGITKNMFRLSEAEAFAAVALSRGVPKDKIIIENQSTNTGENIKFVYNLLKARGLKFNSLLLIQKPYMERRTYATFKKQWPETDLDIVVTSPQIEYENYFDEHNTKKIVLNTMVGDMQRIRVYAQSGFQINQKIPARVWQAYEQLVKLGYDKRLSKL